MKKKKVEVNNQMGKTRDSLKKIGDTKGLFPARRHTIKNRNEKDLVRIVSRSLQLVHLAGLKYYTY